MALDQSTLKTLQTDPGSLIGKGSGSGLYSEVFKGPIPGTVVKRSRVLNDPWLLWAVFCMTRRVPRSGLLKVYAVHVDFKEGKFWAIMEELVSGRDDMPCWMADPDRVLNGDNTFPRLTPDVEEWAPRLIKDFLRWTEKQGEKLSDLFLDAHDDNWMVRKATKEVILTDPLCGSKWSPDALVERFAGKPGVNLTFNQ